MLADLGLRELLERTNEESSDLLEVGAWYRSPEQIKKAPITPASDLFALGICLYEALTAARPFEAPTPFAALIKIRTGKLTAIRERVPGAPADLAALIESMLRPEPSSRPSAEEALAALEPWAPRGPAQEKELAARVAALLPPIPVAAAEPAREAPPEEEEEEAAPTQAVSLPELSHLGLPSWSDDLTDPGEDPATAPVTLPRAAPEEGEDARTALLSLPEAEASIRAPAASPRPDADATRPDVVAPEALARPPGEGASPQSIQILLIALLALAALAVVAAIVLAFAA